MADFEFDEKLSPKDNLDRFFGHLATDYGPLAELLRDNFETLIQSLDGGDRNKARKSFHQKVVKILDAPPPNEKGA